MTKSVFPTLVCISSALIAFANGVSRRTSVHFVKKVRRASGKSGFWGTFVSDFLSFWCSNRDRIHHGIQSNFNFSPTFFSRPPVFDIIIHNVKSKTEYDRYQVIVNRAGPSDSPINLSDLVIPIVPIELNSVFHPMNFLTNHSPRRRFTYRTRFEATLEQNERIQELLGGRSESEFTRLTPGEWRRYIYDRRLFALPLPDMQGRHRECSAEYYRWVLKTLHMENLTMMDNIL